MQRFLRCLCFHSPAVPSALPRGLLLRGPRHFFTGTGAAMYLTAAREKIGSKLRCKAADRPEGCGTVSTEWTNWLSCPLAVLFFLSELSAHRISEVAKLVVFGLCYLSNAVARDEAGRGRPPGSSGGARWLLVLACADAGENSASRRRVSCPAGNGRGRFQAC